ncbi:DUF6497 family protein [Sinirhodobacter sp. WL0062]|uniref:DUF6497 family protein n=1 Tax=Rhodobacter flavimaris TaxID=2907145 RepID=A0ABS8YTS9_9RHOB|nr:DUF6497 family protein [Sinirhodobacter sp. WL0062]MCE5971897.1 DUF6497 family protein [Sinirhodobacter sp. WL0062]
MQGLARGFMVALLMSAFARPVSAQDGAGVLVPVPSGQEVRWIDTISDAPGPGGLTMRFRFLAPQIGGEGPLDADLAATDMQALCDEFALPRLPVIGPRPAQVIISLSDRVVPFGETDEEAVQFFEAYSVVNGLCEWELF